MSNRTGFSVGFLKQFAVLLRRSVMQNLRDHVTNLILLVQAIFLAVLLGLIYIDLDKSQLGIQDRLGVLFFITINSCMGSMFSVMQSFPAEKAIVSRERDARAYSTAAYFLSKVISEIPFKTYNMVVNGTILYWMIGFNPLVDRFLFFVLTQCCLSMSAASIGLMVGSWCPTQETTFAVSPLFMIILMLFGGFFINPDSLPPGSQWVAYISPMNWGFRAFALNDLAGADGWVCDLACVPAGSSDSCGNQPVTDEQHQALSCPEGQVAVVRPGCLQTGDEIIELRLGYDDYTKWECILYMLLSTIGFLSVGYVGLVVTRSRYQPLTNILPSEDLQQEPARNKAPQHNQVGVEGV